MARHGDWQFWMWLIMIKILSFSFILAVLSFVLIFVVPSSVTESGQRLGPSPYAEQIDELSKNMDRGISPHSEKWQEYKELVRKNNEWFEERRGKTEGAPSLDYFDVLQEMSSSISGLLLVVWVGGFLLAFRFLDSYRSPLVLAFPVIMVSLKLISFETFFLIVASVLFLYAVFILWKTQRA
jgi:hypothetical protein